MSARTIFCPKCNSKDVTEKRMTPLPTTLVSMDKLGAIPMAVPTVLQQSLWRATCEDCGYFVEYYA